MLDWVWVGPKPNENGPYKRQKTQIHREGSHMKREVEIGNDVATSQGMPAATGSWKRQGWILSKRLWRECGLLTP